MEPSGDGWSDAVDMALETAPPPILAPPVFRSPLMAEHSRGHGDGHGHGQGHGLGHGHGHGHGRLAALTAAYPSTVGANVGPPSGAPAVTTEDMTRTGPLGHFV